jgi:hypothetical protein
VSEKVTGFKEVRDKYITITRPACYDHSKYEVGDSLPQKSVVVVRK